MKKNILLGILIVMSALSLVFGYYQKERADQQEELAKKNAQIAQEMKEIAEQTEKMAHEQMAIAQQNAMEAMRQRRIVKKN